MLLPYLRTNNALRLLISNQTKFINNKNIIRSLSQYNNNNKISDNNNNKISDNDETNKKNIDIKYNMILSDLDIIKDKQLWIIMFSGIIYFHIIVTSICNLLK